MTQSHTHVPTVWPPSAIYTFSVNIDDFERVFVIWNPANHRKLSYHNLHTTYKHGLYTLMLTVLLVVTSLHMWSRLCSAYTLDHQSDCFYPIVEGGVGFIRYFAQSTANKLRTWNEKRDYLRHSRHYFCRRTMCCTHQLSNLLSCMFWINPQYKPATHSGNSQQTLYQLRLFSTLIFINRVRYKHKMQD